MQITQSQRLLLELIFAFSRKTPANDTRRIYNILNDLCIKANVPMGHLIDQILSGPSMEELLTKKLVEESNGEVNPTALGAVWVKHFGLDNYSNPEAMFNQLNQLMVVLAKKAQHSEEFKATYDKFVKKVENFDLPLWTKE